MPRSLVSLNFHLVGPVAPSGLTLLLPAARGLRPSLLTVAPCRGLTTTEAVDSTDQPEESTVEYVRDGFNHYLRHTA